jgi:adsorption protein B
MRTLFPSSVVESLVSLLIQNDPNLEDRNVVDILIQRTADFFVALYDVFHILALFVGSVFVISGFTDLFVDIFNFGLKIRRWILGRNWPKLTLKRMEAREQQRIAIFIACWHEAEVIAKTLKNAAETIRYKNYDIFVGTYPNDPDTQREVDKVARDNPHIHKVITPDDGPTNKASNLNHVFSALLKYEVEKNRYFDIIVMHDSEDVIHPYSLLVYNYLLPRMEMIQIPVFPIALPLKEMTHWTYADEFAENHTKTLRVREHAGGFVPSAGVGTAFTKRAFQTLALDQDEVFSPNTLTEDYQLGLKFNMHGMRAAFVNIKLLKPQPKTTKKKNDVDWIATRAVFPTDFKRAVKQKTRWNIGIVLQGWENIGWKGSLGVKWDLFQDRKTLISTPVNFLGYVIFTYFLLYSLVDYLSGASMPVLIPDGSLLAVLVLISTIFMVWRSLNRAYSVNLIYGFWPALTSIPRVVLGNSINFFALTRAIIQFTVNKFRKREVAWDKTSHEFPAGVTEESRETVNALKNSSEGSENHFLDLDPPNLIRMFKHRMENADEHEKINILSKVSRDKGELLFHEIVQNLNDPSWEVRAATCRSLSYLCLPQSVPYLMESATDPDWVVRSNAVRALGKLGKKGELALLHLLENDDRYARDAARAVLEQQGFLNRHLKDLQSSDTLLIKHALSFFEMLADAGDSDLAKEILKAYHEMDAGIPVDLASSTLFDLERDLKDLNQIFTIEP